MLLSYSLPFFALTSVNAWRQNLLGNKDHRLTQDGYYFYRVMHIDKQPSWLRDRIYDDVIQFGSVNTLGDSAKVSGVSPDGVSVITHFRLQREFKPFQKYCLHVPQTYDKRFLNGPWDNMEHETGFDQNRNGFFLKGFWGGSKKLPVQVSDFWQA